MLWLCSWTEGPTRRRDGLQVPPLWLGARPLPTFGAPCSRPALGCAHPPAAPHPAFPASLYLAVLLTLRYVWEKDGATLSMEGNPRVRLDRNGSLHISQTWSGDIGTYTCRVLSAGGNDSRSAHLRVR